MVTIVILEIFLSASTSATAKDSILYPLPENSPTTLARTPASLSTQTTNTVSYTHLTLPTKRIV